MVDPPIALVTGATRGIGRQIATELAAAGLVVYVAGRSADAAATVAEAIGGRALQLDVTDEGSIRAAADRLRADAGRLDVLVNNAGISSAGPPGRPLQEAAAAGRMTVVSTHELRTVWETNVFGVVTLTQALLPLLRNAPAARIVNVSSGGASLSRNADPTNPHRAMFGNYSASKVALNAITVAFAAALEPEGIKVNAADPGFTRTDLNNNEGTGSVEDAAREPVRLALLGADGPTGTFSGNDGVLPW